MADQDSNLKEYFEFLRAIEARINERFDSVNQRIDKLDRRLQTVEGQIAGIVALLKPLYDIEARVRKLEEAVFQK